MNTPFPTPVPAELLPLYCNDPLINQAINHGGSMESVIIELVRQRDALLKRLIELESIVPKKIEVDGKTFVLRC